MSTSTISGGDTQASGGSEAPKESQDTKEQKDSVSYDSYKKAIDEKKAMQAKLASYEAKEKAEMEKAGEFRALYESEKEARTALENKAHEDRSRFAYSSVANQFKAEAAKLGCKNLSALEKLVDLKELAKKTDQNFQVDGEAMKAFVEKASKENEFLFAKEAAGFRDAAPAGGKPPAEKPVSQMTLKEKIEALNKQKK